MGLDIYFHRNRSTEVGYFRKVNFLVSFFEESLQEEIQNLHKIVVYKDNIEELLERCNQVLKDHSKAEELLPTRPGFYFGTYEYDEYYFEDVKQVRDYCQEILLPLFDKIDPDEYITFEIWY